MDWGELFDGDDEWEEMVALHMAFCVLKCLECDRDGCLAVGGVDSCDMPVLASDRYPGDCHYDSDHSDW